MNGNLRFAPGSTPLSSSLPAPSSSHAGQMLYSTHSFGMRMGMSFLPMLITLDGGLHYSAPMKDTFTRARGSEPPLRLWCRCLWLLWFLTSSQSAYRRFRQTYCFLPGHRRGAACAFAQFLQAHIWHCRIARK